jgi:hypothetical protein
MKNTQDDQKETPVADHDSAIWTIDAASGWQHVQCRSLGVWHGSGILCCDLRLRGEFWDRRKALAQAGIVPDFHVTLPQILMSVSALNQLRAHLDDWIGSKFGFDCQICPVGVGDQALMISVGARDDLINSSDKPVLTLSFRCGPAMTAEWAFVLDQSCISAWRDSLQDFLQAIHGRQEIDLPP